MSLRSNELFTLEDFPVGSEMYWVRNCSFKEITPAVQIVYTKVTISEVNDKYVAYEVKTKTGQVNTVIHEDFAFFSAGQHGKGACVPGYLYDALKGKEVALTGLTDFQRLSVLLQTTGNYELDDMIRKVQYSFKELNAFSKKMQKE